MRTCIRMIVLSGALCTLAGCATSRVHFTEPRGAVLMLQASGTQLHPQTYTFPAAIDLPQRDSPAGFHSDVGGRPVQLVLPDHTNVKGFLYVYKLNMDQVEKLAQVTFSLTPEQIAKLPEPTQTQSGAQTPQGAVRSYPPLESGTR